MWRCSLLVPLLLVAGCERYPSGGGLRVRRDMVDQPSFRPQRDPLPAVAGAIPAEGWEPEITREAALRLVNPVAATPASIDRGRQLYAIACRHCHGTAGHGNGPVSAKITRPANLASGKYVEAPDGLFYYTMRYGGVIMPPQTETLAAGERWHVVNFLRRMQKP